MKKNILILTLLLPFIYSCSNDIDLSESYLDAKIMYVDGNTNRCVVKFVDEDPVIENVFGKSAGFIYNTANLVKDENLEIGSLIKIKARKAKSSEIPAGTTLYASYNYPYIFITDYIVSTFDYNEEVEIPVTCSVISRDKKYVIRFDSVLTDSRCPEGVECFWAGVAGVRLTVSDKASSQTFDLYTINNNLWSDSAAYKDMKIKLLGLIPYPSAYAKYSYKSYRATIKLIK